MSRSLELQKAIFARLRSDSALTALLAPSVLDSGSAVYDAVPQVDDTGSGLEFPFVAIGDDTILEWDTDDAFGTEATVTLHIWSRQQGRSEVKAIQGAIYDALHFQNLSITGYHTVVMLCEFEETMMDSDTYTRHGVSRYRIIFHE